MRSKRRDEGGAIAVMTAFLCLILTAGSRIRRRRGREQRRALGARQRPVRGARRDHVGRRAADGEELGRPGRAIADAAVSQLRANGVTGEVEVWFWEAPSSQLPTGKRSWAWGVQSSVEGATGYATIFGGSGSEISAFITAHAVPYTAGEAWRPSSERMGNGPARGRRGGRGLFSSASPRLARRPRKYKTSSRMPSERGPAELGNATKERPTMAFPKNKKEGPSPAAASRALMLTEAQAVAKKVSRLQAATAALAAVCVASLGAAAWSQADAAGRIDAAFAGTEQVVVLAGAFRRRADRGIRPRDSQRPGAARGRRRADPADLENPKTSPVGRLATSFAAKGSQVTSATAAGEGQPGVACRLNRRRLRGRHRARRLGQRHGRACCTRATP